MGKAVQTRAQRSAPRHPELVHQMLDKASETVRTGRAIAPEEPEGGPQSVSALRRQLPRYRYHRRRRIEVFREVVGCPIRSRILFGRRHIVGIADKSAHHDRFATISNLAHHKRRKDFVDEFWRQRVYIAVELGIGGLPFQKRVFPPLKQTFAATRTWQWIQSAVMCPPPVPLHNAPQILPAVQVISANPFALATLNAPMQWQGALSNARKGA